MPETVFLDKYQNIMSNYLPSRSRLLKNIHVTFDRDCNENELWALHERYMEIYRENKKKTYLSGINEENQKVQNNLLDLKIRIAEKIIENCHLCHHRCKVNRKKGEKGFCKLTDSSRYAAEFLHMGEEPELVPSHTVFFTGCVLSCVYCQNWDISMHPETGRQLDIKELTARIDRRRMEGSKNLNLVTPTPHLHNILKIIKDISVNIPVIWNSNMYHSLEAAKLLEGVVDLYLPDFKYGNNRCAMKYSKIKEYVETVTANLKYASMDAEILMRHLVLPGHLDCCTKKIIDWTAGNIPEIRFNLMFQYRPEYLACMYPEINRHLTSQEKEKAIKMAKESGIKDFLI